MTGLSDISNSSKILTIQQGQHRGVSSVGTMAEISTTWSTSLVFLIKWAGVWQNAEVAWFTLLYCQNLLRVHLKQRIRWNVTILLCMPWSFQEYAGHVEGLCAVIFPCCPRPFTILIHMDGRDIDAVKKFILCKKNTLTGERTVIQKCTDLILGADNKWKDI